MFKYKVTFTWGLVDMVFESKYHVAMMKVTHIGLGRLMTFEDTKISIDLARVEEMRINGKRYKLKTYEI